MNKNKCKNEQEWVPPKWASAVKYFGGAIFVLGIILGSIGFIRFEWVLGIGFLGGIFLAIGVEGEVPPDVPGIWENDY